MITLLTLSKGDYAGALAGAFVIGIAFTFLLWLVKRQIDANSAWKIRREQMRIEQQRREIRAAVDAALGVGDEDELDPDDFELSVHDWDQKNEVWYADHAPDDPLCAKGGVLCERTAGHGGECTPAG